MTTTDTAARPAHTPGPWMVDEGFSYFTISGADGAEVVTGIDGETSELASYSYGVVHEADARLIAAAPELLAALEAAISYIEDDSRSPRRRAACLVGFRAAIAKATGGEA